MCRSQKRRKREVRRLAPPAGLPVESVMYHLRRVLSQQDIATAMRVTRQKVQNWECTRLVEDDVLQRLRGLLGILWELNTHASLGEVRKWMRMKNRWCDGRRALDIYAEDDGEKIREAIKKWVHSMDQNGI